MGGVTGAPGNVTITPVYWAPPGYQYTPRYKLLVNGYIRDVALASRQNTNVFSVGTQYYQQANFVGAPLLHIQYVVRAGVEVDDSTAFPAQNLNPGCVADAGFTDCVTDPALRTELQRFLAGLSLPMDDSQLYLVFFPRGVETCFGPGSARTGTGCSTNVYCAYHSAVRVGPSFAIYGNEPFPDLNSCSVQQAPNRDAEADAQTILISHEANESITDWAGAWIDSAGYENGDQCSWVFGLPLGSTGAAGTLYNQVIGTGKYYTQDEFSNEDYALNIGDPVAAGGAKVPGCVQRDELPTASFTSPASVVSGTTAAFNGSASSDPDNVTPLIYAWTWGDGTANGAGPTPTHLFTTVGTPNVTLTVTDVDGWSSSTSRVVNVTPSFPTVTAMSPTFGPVAGGTAVTITGSGFTGVSSVAFGGVAAASFAFVNDGLITAVSPAHAAATVDVRVTTPGGPSAISAADKFTFFVRITSCTTSQYSLTGNNGSTWVNVDAANLLIAFTPSVDSYAVLGGNADLWTSSAGFNQDIGIGVTGGIYPKVAAQPEGWKESGGFAGTFSPNAAFVQTVIAVVSGTAYTAKLQWKTNIADPGTIFAGAGPIAGRFSPTCISVELIPIAPVTTVAKSSTTQYTLAGNNGATWMNVDATNLSFSYTPPSAGVVLVSGNADLWTSSSGFNQDIGVSVSGGAYPTTAGQPETWKESGGFAGTFSPNAAFVNAPLAVTAIPYTFSLQWKTNKADPGTIYAGAGPVGGKFSPTTLTVLFFPAASAPLDGPSTLQYQLPNSDGSTWTPIDATKLKVNITPTNECQVFVSGNADLWTANAGINQDIGISISGGTFPTFPGQPEAWKESGGFAGTFSPNAAFVQTVVTLHAGTAYTIQLVWKSNKPAPGQTIFAGAGPIGAKFSPSRVTLTPLGC